MSIKNKFNPDSLTAPISEMLKGDYKRMTYGPLSNADTIIEREVISKPKKDEPEKSLLDAALESTYEYHKFHKNKPRREAMYEAQVHSRIKLRAAIRFAVDDDSVRNAARLAASTSPEELKGLMNLTQLPYANTWLEFNLHAKIQAFKDASGDQTPISPRTPGMMGLLLERDAHRDYAWACTLYTKVPISPKKPDEEKVAISVLPHPCVYLFDAMGSYRDQLPSTADYGPFILQVNGPSGRPEEYANLAKGLRSFMWGYRLRNPEQKIQYDDRIKEELERLPAGLLEHGQISMAELYLRYWSAADKDPGPMEREEPLNVLSYFVEDNMENTGMMRFVVTLLSLFNTAPKTNRIVHPTGRRMLGSTMKPYLDYHVVSFSLPKENTIAFAKRLLKKHARARDNRAHMVEGHWHTTVKKTNRTPCPNREHDWYYDHPAGKRICLRCETEGVFIKEYPRGNDKLGFVSKEYQTRATAYYDRHPEKRGTRKHERSTRS